MNYVRLIDANDAEKFAREHILDAKERFLILDFLRECSTVDAVEVVHGRWVRVPSSDMMTGKAYKCSECNKTRYGSFMPNYCGNCGAKMDGVQK